MAIGNVILSIFSNGKKLKNSKDIEGLFKSLGVTSDGTDKGTNITEVSGAFSFNSKKLSSIANGSADTDAASVGQMNTAVGAKVNTSAVGAANGVCPLGADTKVPSINLPSYVDDVLESDDFASLPTVGAKGVYTGTPAGCSTPVTVTATDKGTAGNITLTGNGVKTVSVLISDWNTAHPTNTVGLTSGDGDQVPNDTVELALTGGVTPLAEAGKIYVTKDNNKSWRYTGTAYIEVSPGPGSTDALTEGSTNKYFTPERAQTATIETAAITEDLTTKAPSSQLVFDALAGKAASGHNHDGAYAALSHNHDGAYAALGHNHDGSYAAIGHNHDSAYAALSHNHDSSYQAKSDLYRSFTNKEGSGISIRQFVFQSAAGQCQLLKADDAVNEYSVIGCVKDATIANDVAGNIWLPRKGTVIGGFESLDVTKPVYASRATAGAYVQVLTGFLTGEKVVLLGMPLSTTEIEFIGEVEYELGFDW